MEHIRELEQEVAELRLDAARYREALTEAKDCIIKYADSTYECQMSDYKVCCSELSRKPHLDWCPAIKAIKAINAAMKEMGNEISDAASVL